MCSRYVENAALVSLGGVGSWLPRSSRRLCGAFPLQIETRVSPLLTPRSARRPTHLQNITPPIRHHDNHNILHDLIHKPNAPILALDRCMLTAGGDQRGETGEEGFDSGFWEGSELSGDEGWAEGRDGEGR